MSLKESERLASAGHSPRGLSAAISRSGASCPSRLRDLVSSTITPRRTWNCWPWSTKPMSGSADRPRGTSSSASSRSTASRSSSGWPSSPTATCTTCARIRATACVRMGRRGPRPSRSANGASPSPNAQPGFLRIDTVHQAVATYLNGWELGVGARGLGG
jgi:hypothetical protein